MSKKSTLEPVQQYRQIIKIRIVGLFNKKKNTENYDTNGRRRNIKMLKRELSQITGFAGGLNLLSPLGFDSLKSIIYEIVNTRLGESDLQTEKCFTTVIFQVAPRKEYG